MSEPTYHIFYDGTCVLCQRSKAWLERRHVTGKFVFVDSRDPAAMAKWPAVTMDEAEGRMVVLGPAGRKQGGYDGILLLMSAMRGWRWARPLLAAPGIRPLGRHVYRLIARNRYRWFGRTSCDAGACRV